MDQLADIVQTLIFGLAQGGIYALIAVGFTIIFSSTQVVNFAHGEFVMIGAIVSAWLCVLLGWPLWLVIPTAMLAAMIVGLLLGWLLMRPLKSASPVSLIIITIGASMLLQGVASMIWGKDPLVATAFSAIASYNVHLTAEAAGPTLIIQSQQLWILGIALLVVTAMTLFFRFTLVGKAMRAVAVNRHGAQLTGINVSRMVYFAFALAALIGALAGAAIAPLSSASYNMGTMLGMKGFAAAIVGGLGNFPGSVIAGLLLGVLETFGAGYISSSYKDAFAFIIILVVLIISPQGILAFRKKGKC